MIKKVKAKLIQPRVDWQSIRIELNSCGFDEALILQTPPFYTLKEWLVEVNNKLRRGDQKWRQGLKANIHIAIVNKNVTVRKFPNEDNDTTTSVP